jgi:diketogulonate reductase-like aldo/keto reductase
VIERAIPSTNERVPVIGLGTWQTFDVSSATAKQQLAAVLDRFAAGGGRLIDSSPMYGRAEDVVGELRAHLPNAFVATKVWTRGRAEGEAEIERSMRRMRARPIDLIQIHNLLDWRTQLATLRRMKADGTMRYIGITHYQTAAFRDLESIMRDEELDFVQLPMSVVLPDAERRLLPLAAERRIAVIVNRPFEGGSLFRGGPVPAVARDLGCATWADVFLRWIVAHEEVTCVIPATANVAHLEENLRAGDAPLLTLEERERLRGAVAR